MVTIIDEGYSNSNFSQVERHAVQYDNLSQKYVLWDVPPASQYYKSYAARLEILQPKVISTAERLWSGVKVKKLCELQNYCGRCVIVGTIFKKQTLKPSILKEISLEHHLMPQPVLENYVSDTDEITLEDEIQRIHLVGNINAAKLVNGIICAVLGQQDIAGKFTVSDICFAELPANQPREITSTDKFVLITSGLDLSTSSDRSRLEMLVDYVVGNLCCPSEQNDISNIVRVIIAGNLIRADKKETVQNKGCFIQEADEFIAQIASRCPIDVMPGEFDPCNYSMPQQPLHRCLFSMAGQYETMRSVTNPYECEIGGRIIIGTSGQNVKNICQCSTLTNSIDVLKKICDWGHIAPTAPDTLISYPFELMDPFIINMRPDVMFVANQTNFAVEVIHEDSNPVVLLSVPRFSLDGVCVLLNLKTLECKPIQFSSPLFEDNLSEVEK